MKKTTVTIKEDKPVSLASTAYGSKLNVTAFNIDFIAERDPGIVKEIHSIYERVKTISTKPPQYPFESRFDNSILPKVIK